MELFLTFLIRIAPYMGFILVGGAIAYFKGKNKKGKDDWED